MFQAIEECVKPGVKYREVGNIIQKHAQSEGFSVVRSYCGHGIHKLFHCAPNVPHYAKNKAVGVMKPGHAFTIEPMISEGAKILVVKDGVRLFFLILKMLSRFQACGTTRRGPTTGPR